MEMIQIEAQIAWRCRRADGDRWLAVSEPLGLIIQSEKYSELAEDIGDALDLLFADLLDSGELDQFLAKRGWHRAAGPLPKRAEEAKFDVPFELLLNHGNGSTARVHQ